MTENKRILPIRENFTYAFRARAKNSAGYGGYSEIWMVLDGGGGVRFHIKGK